MTNGINQTGIYSNRGRVNVKSTSSATISIAGANGKGIHVANGGSVSSEKYSYELSEEGLPVVTQNTLAFIAAQTVKEEDLGTHIMFIGKVTQSKVLAQEEPMSYDFYHNVLKGKTPKGATTFQGS
jgi:flavin reductase (DIM6/NTAB) family NADH-FMN oxidoreductase RutF